jgi:hypothetical protein
MSGPTIRALESAITKSSSPTSNVFANLERVIMSGEYDTFPWGRNQTDFNIFHRSLTPAPMPLFLLSLSNVKHYCQWTPTGPLALPNRIIKIDNPPEIVTIHYPHMLETGVHSGSHLSFSVRLIDICSGVTISRPREPTLAKMYTSSSWLLS